MPARCMPFTVAAVPKSARIGSAGCGQPPPSCPRGQRPAPGHPHRNASDKADTEHPYLRGRATHTVRQQHGTHRRVRAREPGTAVITEGDVEPGRLYDRNTVSERLTTAPANRGTARISSRSAPSA